MSRAIINERGILFVDDENDFKLNIDELDLAEHLINFNLEKIQAFLKLKFNEIQRKIFAEQQFQVYQSQI